MRDLLLSRPIGDVDLVLEKDALAFAKRLGRELNARPRVHPRFRTATLQLPEGWRVDIATARSESYARPGALPRVRAAVLSEDLARRDFTINAMALEIAPRGKGRLLDPFGGREDVRSRLVRMLHPRSPHDDPTRAFRAVRYAVRLGFSIERETRRWIREAVADGSFERVSGDRLRRELELLFSEKGWARKVVEIAKLGLTGPLHPALSGSAVLRSRVARAERLARCPGSTWLSALLAWASELSEREAGELAARLSLVGAAGRALRAWPETLRGLRGFCALPPSRARTLAGRLSPDECVAAAASLPPADRGALREAAANPVELRIRGRDLLAAGVPAGREIGLALVRTLSARLEGVISEEEELSYALKSIRRAP